MAIAAVRVQVPSRVRIRGKVRANALTFLFSRPEPSLLERMGGKQKSRPQAWLFLFQNVRAGLAKFRRNEQFPSESVKSWQFRAFKTFGRDSPTAQQEVIPVTYTPITSFHFLARDSRSSEGTSNSRPPTKYSMDSNSCLYFLH